MNLKFLVLRLLMRFIIVWCTQMALRASESYYTFPQIKMTRIQLHIFLIFIRIRSAWVLNFIIRLVRAWLYLKR